MLPAYDMNRRCIRSYHRGPTYWMHIRVFLLLTSLSMESVSAQDESSGEFGVVVPNRLRCHSRHDVESREIVNTIDNLSSRPLQVKWQLGGIRISRYFNLRPGGQIFVGYDLQGDTPLKRTGFAVYGASFQRKTPDFQTYVKPRGVTESTFDSGSHGSSSVAHGTGADVAAYRLRIWTERSETGEYQLVFDVTGPILIAFPPVVRAQYNGPIQVTLDYDPGVPQPKSIKASDLAHSPSLAALDCSPEDAWIVDPMTQTSIARRIMFVGSKTAGTGNSTLRDANVVLLHRTEAGIRSLAASIHLSTDAHGTSRGIRRDE